MGVGFGGDFVGGGWCGTDVDGGGVLPGDEGPPPPGKVERGAPLEPGAGFAPFDPVLPFCPPGAPPPAPVDRVPPGGGKPTGEDFFPPEVLALFDGVGVGEKRLGNWNGCLSQSYCVRKSSMNGPPCPGGKNATTVHARV